VDKNASFNRIHQRPFNLSAIKAKDYDFDTLLRFVDPFDQPLDTISRLDEQFHDFARLLLVGLDADLPFTAKFISLQPPQGDRHPNPELLGRYVNSAAIWEITRIICLDHGHSLLMRRYIRCFCWMVATVISCSECLVAQQAHPAVAAPAETVVLWRDPGNIKSRDLYYGPGGQKDEPQRPTRFLEEDPEGNSPKFVVEDAAGKKWKAKLGLEAQPEPVANRLLWAIGYNTNENYFLPKLKVENLPSRLTRGQKFVETDSEVEKVRLQRHPGHEKKVGTWKWKPNPLAGTREFNGLRVMMALINNWDLKDNNNAIYEDNASGRKSYEVTDVGASFGASGKRCPDSKSKGNLAEYRKSKFISKITPDFVDFHFPTRPPLLYVVSFRFFFHQLHNRWIGKHIPRADARWVGNLLAQLSPEQLREAFRAGGYSPEQVEGYVSAVKARIAALQNL